jgi:hypothetical protein
MPREETTEFHYQGTPDMVSLAEIIRSYPTSHLRYVERSADPQRSRLVLQQEWVTEEYGAGQFMRRLEWRDVPIENEG